MPETATETGIAEKFAPLRRDFSTNPSRPVRVGRKALTRRLIYSGVPGFGGY